MKGKVQSGESGSRGIRSCNPETGTAAPLDSSELSVQKSAMTRNTQDTVQNPQTLSPLTEEHRHTSPQG